MNEADLVMHFARIADSSPQKNTIGPYCILRKDNFASGVRKREILPKNRDIL